MNYEAKDDRIYNLIIRSFSGDLNSDEVGELNKWLNANDENKHEYNDYHEIWKGSERLRLTSKINVPEVLADVRKSAGISKRVRKIIYSFARVAAILVLAVIISVVYNKFFNSSPSAVYTANETVYQNIRAAFGTQSQVVLPDGTSVFLNSGSTLRFPATFKDSKTRMVELTGEGFFSVVKNENQPFIVATDKFQVKVLGTTFNVNAYPGSSSYTVALVEGKVNIEQPENVNSKIVEMQKNQICYFNTSNNQLQLQDEKDLGKYTQWINGKIVFYNDRIQTVVEKLENWYNIDIEIADKKLETYRFTGTFVDEPVEQVLDMLNLTSNMHYKVYSAKKMEDNTYSKRKIVLKSK